METQDKKIQCECCEAFFAEGDIHYGTDPFAEEIHGDMTLRWLCEECRYQSAMDI